MIGCHCHSDVSNLRLLDALNSVEELITTSYQMGYKGVAITDHESVSAHVKAIKTVREFKEKGKIPQDFKLILGNECYLVDDLESVKDNYKSGETKFPHFLLLSTSKQGHEILRMLSSRAWSRSFYTGTMERVPTLKADLEELVKPNQGLIIGSSACLGSESSIHLLAIKEAEEKGFTEKAQYHREKLHEFITWCIDIFGKDYFFLEIQPAYSHEQIYVNEKLVQMAKYYELKLIVTTDAHYARPEDRIIHKAFLNSKDGDRETELFYEACFIQRLDEIHERLSYLPREIVEEAIKNTELIGGLCEDYTIEHSPIIPRISLPEFNVSHLFQPAYDQYSYINKMANSEHDQDQFLLKLIEDGFQSFIPFNTLSKEKFHIILKRIDVELEELWEISNTLNQRMTSYYITVREIINIIWNDDCGGNSLVGSGRGSAAGYLINYLLGITQVNPLEYEIELPHWRHIHKSRPDIPDIDVDTEASKRQQIIQALRQYFGEDRLLQVCTFGTEGSKSALQTACRGLGIDTDIALYLSGMIPFERGQNWSLSDCFFGNEDKERKAIKEFIREVEKYPNLKETALKIEGLINKRSIHASGVIVFNEEYYKTNAMMKAPNGFPITQFNLHDSESVGNVKFDLLTIEALDKIRTNLDMLLEYNEIQWQGTLRNTFNTYLHPDKLEYNDPAIWKALGEGKIMDLFQFSTDIGLQSAIKVKPSSLLEMAAANSLMRLMSDGDEQPIDTYIKYKNDISLWYEEMNKQGLNQDEVSVLEEHLLKLYGVADTQESVMLLSMDKRIAGFDVKEANKLRKAIAKKQDKKSLDAVRDSFYKSGRELGNSEAILDYVWNVQIKRQLGYAFSVLHTLAYSIVAVQELNLNHKYNSLYWSTACLSVNAGSTENEQDEDNANKSTNYGKIAYAIGNIRQMGVKVDLPDINKAGFGFKPDLDNNSILFGLKGMNGIGDEIVHLIIENRPYQSFNDFLEKMYDTKLIKNSHMNQLIKGGCFDSFGERKDVMKQFTKHTFEPKKQLNFQNMKMLVENNLIPEQFNLNVRFYNYKNYISQFVHKTVVKPKDRLFILDNIATPFFEQHFTEECIVDMVDGSLIISEKKFKKEYDKKMEDLKEWLGTEETLNYVNDSLLNQAYSAFENDSISQWEMDSLSYYYHDHELAAVDYQKYGLDNFNELPEQPIVVNEYVSRGIPRQEFKLNRIAGTVLDKDKNKHQVTLLTTDGVVTIKLYAGAFSHYNKQISKPIGKDKKEIVESSWFTRGNKLLVTGFRRGNKFVPRKYKNSIYQHTIALIKEIDQEGSLILQTERAEN
jgi:DNA polymerase-3 subunit alpha